MTGRGTMENGDGGDARRRVRLYRQAVRSDAYARDRKARRGRLHPCRISRRESEVDDLPETEMIGSSAPMVAIYKMISRVAPTDATVLIEGENRKPGRK